MSRAVDFHGPPVVSGLLGVVRVLAHVTLSFSVKYRGGIGSAIVSLSSRGGGGNEHHCS